MMTSSSYFLNALPPASLTETATTGFFGVEYALLCWNLLSKFSRVEL
jgi:hypothetical protein